MNELKPGDIVARKSYGLDVLFKVVEIIQEEGCKKVILKGIDYRIQADAPESDLIIQSDKEVIERNMRIKKIVDMKYRNIAMSRGTPSIKKRHFRDTSNDNSQKFFRSGKVLHIDGDDDYLQMCIEQYKKFGIDVIGKSIPEKDQASYIFNLLKEHRPDILVLTGHDGVLKSESAQDDVANYRNSIYFIESVKEARKYEGNMDNLAIFAGACQSMYNEIINAGANYASSPNRVLIHALDPVFVCQKIAFERFDRIVDPVEVVNSTITGSKGIGGMQTLGKYRTGFPKEPYNAHKIK